MKPAAHPSRAPESEIDEEDLSVIDQHDTLLSTGDIRVGSVNFKRMQPQRMPEAIYMGINNGK